MNDKTQSISDLIDQFSQLPSSQPRNKVISHLWDARAASMFMDGYNINFDSKTSHAPSQTPKTAQIMLDVDRCLCADPINAPVVACPVHGF
jgi:hypothetical protein